MMDGLKCLRTIVTSVLILTSCGLHLCLGEAWTFFGDGSYLKTQPFRNSSSLILRFTFQTSKLYGVLLLTGDSDPSFVVEIRNGSLVIENYFSGEKETDILDNGFVNDNAPHTLTIYHEDMSLRFYYCLDSKSAVFNSYARDRNPNFGTSGFYFGGGPLANGRAYEGCLRDILFDYTVGQDSCTGFSDSDLQNVSIAIANGTFGSCSDLCDRVNCGSGTCVAQWPNDYFCDCRDSDQLGPSCSENADNFTVEFPSQNELYFCYVPTYAPSLKIDGNEAGNTFTVQLLPPIPSEGTIVTAFARDGFFSLRMENNKLIFKYNNLSTRIRTNLNDIFPPITLDVADRSQAYQIDLAVSKRRASLSLRQLSSSSNTQNGTSSASRSQELMYLHVCVGGSLLDVRNYHGLMRRALFNYNSLFEERNACLLQSRREKPSDFVSFTAPLSKAFILEKVTVQTYLVTFQIRLGEESDSLKIFEFQNDPNSVILATVNGNEGFSLFVDTRILIAVLPDFSNDMWYQVEIRSYFSGQGQDSINITVNGVTASYMDFHAGGNVVGPNPTVNLSVLVGDPAFILFTTNMMTIPFVGCMRNFQFQETPTSEAVRLNLDALTHLAPDSYAVDNSHETCFGCRTRAITCRDDQICSDMGYSEPLTCTEPEAPIKQICREPTTTVDLPMSTTPLNTFNPPSSPPVTSEDVTTTTPPSQGGAGGIGAGAAAGIGIGITILVALLIAGILALLICKFHQRGQGFYHTNESNDKDLSLGHFNTSLGLHSAETVATDLTHEDDWSVKNGGHSNGGPPPYPLSKPNDVTYSSRDKEFYL